jgi:hypothetical protein
MMANPKLAGKFNGVKGLLLNLLAISDAAKTATKSGNFVIV